MKVWGTRLGCDAVLFSEKFLEFPKTTVPSSSRPSGQNFWFHCLILKTYKPHEPLAPPHSITSNKSRIWIHETNIGHKMCVAIVVQLLPETSFLLLDIYSCMHVTLEMCEEKLFCPVFTRIWIAGHFLNVLYQILKSGCPTVGPDTDTQITDLQMWPSNKVLLLLCETLLMGSLITTWCNILLGPVILCCVQPDCFVWISEQTAILSLYSINWLVFVTKMESVYCAVWTNELTT